MYGESHVDLEIAGLARVDPCQRRRSGAGSASSRFLCTQGAGDVALMISSILKSASKRYHFQRLSRRFASNSSPAVLCGVAVSEGGGSLTCFTCLFGSLNYLSALTMVSFVLNVLLFTLAPSQIAAQQKTTSSVKYCMGHQGFRDPHHIHIIFNITLSTWNPISSRSTSRTRSSVDPKLESSFSERKAATWQQVNWKAATWRWRLLPSKVASSTRTVQPGGVRRVSVNCVLIVMLAIAIGFFCVM